MREQSRFDPQAETIERLTPGAAAFITARKRLRQLVASSRDSSTEDISIDTIHYNMCFAVQGFGEIDAIQPESIGAYPEGEGAIYIDVSLFADRSPFMFESDIAKGRDVQVTSESRGGYVIIITPESEPFIGWFDSFEVSGVAGLRDYREALRRGEETPYVLNAEDCHELVGILHSPQLDAAAHN